MQERLRRVPGTDTVEIFGAPQEEILVSIDATRAHRPRIWTRPGVSAAIAAADAKVSAGRLQGGEQEMVVEIAGEIDDLARIRAIPLATGADGAVLRLGDWRTSPAPRSSRRKASPGIKAALPSWWRRGW